MQVPTVVANVTRFPNVPPFNVFMLTCTASLPREVNVPIRFTWKRRMGTEDHSLEAFSYSASLSIFNATTNQSTIILQEMNSGLYRYRCRVELDSEDLGDVHRLKDQVIRVARKFNSNIMYGDAATHYVVCICYL